MSIVESKIIENVPKSTPQNSAKTTYRYVQQDYAQARSKRRLKSFHRVSGWPMVLKFMSGSESWDTSVCTRMRLLELPRFNLWMLQISIGTVCQKFALQWPSPNWKLWRYNVPSSNYFEILQEIAEIWVDFQRVW